MTLEEWEKDVENLDNRINALTVWNDYAVYLQREYDNRINALTVWNDYVEYLQREYDILLSQRPKD